MQSAYYSEMQNSQLSGHYVHMFVSRSLYASSNNLIKMIKKKLIKSV